MFESKVPGSIFLFGEHSVLYGYPAIIAAIDKYITVKLIPRSDKVINIYSNAFANFSTDLNTIKLGSDYKFAVAAILQLKSQLVYGFDLHFESQFSHEIGFGSSGAVSVATVDVVAQYLSLKLQKHDLFVKAYDAVQLAQNGLGSGADVAASVYQTLIFYNNGRVETIKIKNQFALLASYVGYKVATAKVLQVIESNKHGSMDKIFKLMADVTYNAKNAFSNLDGSSHKEVGHLMNCYHGLLNALGVSDLNLEKLCFKLRSIAGVYGSKISGSGLGDCVIAIGNKNCSYNYDFLIKLEVLL